MTSRDGWQGAGTQLPLVAIAGGGIAGMYTAWKLAEEGRFFPVLMERSKDRWGGRIETVDLDRFVAEVGPMRFQINVQPKFRQLVADLGVELVEFSGPSPGRIDWPRYDLAEDEKNRTSLELLYRGVVRIAGRDPDHPDTESWVRGLTEADYDGMRRNAQIDGQPMWQLGIWNGLGSVLSHQAVMLIGDGRPRRPAARRDRAPHRGLDRHLRPARLEPPPFGAANHSWRPGVQSLDVRATFRAFGWPNRPRNLHVCGEAYSDYSSFIEGSLRTAEDAMDAIRRGTGETKSGGAT